MGEGVCGIGSDRLFEQIAGEQRVEEPQLVEAFGVEPHDVGARRQ